MAQFPGVLAAIMLVVPAIALAQTYDTPASLVVTISGPTYLVVDQDGYAVVTGVVHNDSEYAYVGNVQVQARFYDGSGNEPLDVAVGATHLEVIPPGSSSPFTVRSTAPDPRINEAATTLLLFDSSGPKPAGIGLEAVVGDSGGIFVTASDTAGAPHTNVTVHVAYHDAFDPPRILSISTIKMGDMPIDGTLNATAADQFPLSARGYLVFAESDVFSSKSVAGRLPAPTEAPAGPAAHVREAWISDDTGERTSTVERGQEVAFNASVVSAAAGGDGPYWLYLQVKSLGDDDYPVVVFLDRTEVSLDGEVSVSIPWSAPEPGHYFAEAVLSGDLNVPVAEPGPVVLFTVE